jgi:hypothetical protein
MRNGSEFVVADRLLKGDTYKVDSLECETSHETCYWEPASNPFADVQLLGTRLLDGRTVVSFQLKVPQGL